MSLPVFPLFRKMKIRDRREIESVTAKFLPYSDFNFVSLWSYNTNDDIMLSVHNGNLIVRFLDYINTDKYVYSFIGDHKPEKTIEALFGWMKNNRIPPQLGLIPEADIGDDLKRNDKFKIREDPDNFDYVISISKLATLTGNANKHKRWRVNKFVKNNSNVTAELLDLRDKNTQNEILAVFDRWMKAKNISRKDAKNELTAIKRLLRDLPDANLVCPGLRVGGKLTGWSIEEILPDHYAMGHFMKTDFSDDSAYDYLRKITADYLLDRECVLINCEQNLGEERLREAKLSLKPVNFLKKYIISPRPNE